jgi:hypothetical protein
MLVFHERFYPTVNCEAQDCRIVECHLVSQIRLLIDLELYNLVDELWVVQHEIYEKWAKALAQSNLDKKIEWIRGTIFEQRFRGYSRIFYIIIP